MAGETNQRKALKNRKASKKSEKNDLSVTRISVRCFAESTIKKIAGKTANQ
tara:strand:+ start:518 stop:670 length:153 start_codon:yes stop_codon:yes gene_type:complete